MTPDQLNELAAREAYDREPVASPEDAQRLASALTEALLLGKLPTAREAGFLLWLLRPLVVGELQAQALPFKPGQFRRKRKKADDHPERVLIVIQYEDAMKRLGDSEAALQAVARAAKRSIDYVQNAVDNRGRYRVKGLSEKTRRFLLAVAQHEQTRNLKKGPRS